MSVPEAVTGGLRIPFLPKVIRGKMDTTTLG
jgi:hypothetical protein